MGARARVSLGEAERLTSRISGLRGRLREIAGAGGPTGLEADSDAAGGPGALAAWAGSADPAQARLSAATQAALDAATRAAARAAAPGVARATARDSSLWYVGG